VISLRPVGQHAAVRRAAARAGMGCIAVSTMRIAPGDDATTRARLRDALAAPIVVFTSPNAVHGAARLATLRASRKRTVCAIGAGTAAALQRAGIGDVLVPPRADSDALLSLDALRDVSGMRIGLVTAPGGRDRIAPVLRSRGADVVRADVYAREPMPPPARAWHTLREARGHLAIALSSSDALATFLAHAPPDLLAKVRTARVLAGSERLAGEARRLGFADIRLAASARPADLVDAVAGDAAGVGAARVAASRDGRRRRAIR